MTPQTIFWSLFASFSLSIIFLAFTMILLFQIFPFNFFPSTGENHRQRHRTVSVGQSGKKWETCSSFYTNFLAFIIIIHGLRSVWSENLNNLKLWRVAASDWWFCYCEKTIDARVCRWWDVFSSLWIFSLFFLCESREICVIVVLIVDSTKYIRAGHLIHEEAKLHSLQLGNGIRDDAWKWFWYHRKMTNTHHFVNCRNALLAECGYFSSHPLHALCGEKCDSETKIQSGIEWKNIVHEDNQGIWKWRNNNFMMNHASIESWMSVPMRATHSLGFQIFVNFHQNSRIFQFSLSI